MNRGTHAFEGARTAQLRGWRRVWRYTTQRRVAYLTVVEDSDCAIDGLIAPVPDQDWAALDYRERAYTRVPAAHQISHSLTHNPEIAVYAVPKNTDGGEHRNHTLLLSYIDVVVQGYLREFGPKGAARFFATTSGWSAPILNDRAAPRYPRYCQLSSDEIAFVDDHLHRLRATIQKDTSVGPSGPWQE